VWSISDHSGIAARGQSDFRADHIYCTGR